MFEHARKAAAALQRPGALLRCSDSAEGRPRRARGLGSITEGSRFLKGLSLPSGQHAGGSLQARPASSPLAARIRPNTPRSPPRSPSSTGQPGTPWDLTRSPGGSSGGAPPPLWPLAWWPWPTPTTAADRLGSPAACLWSGGSETDPRSKPPSVPIMGTWGLPASCASTW